MEHPAAVRAARALDEQTTKRIIGKACERLETMRAERSGHEQCWRELAEYCVPRRNFEITYGRPSIRQRRLVDTTGIIVCERLAALIFGHMLPPYEFIRPTVYGRDASPREARWFERRKKTLFEGMQSPRSNFMSAGHESIVDDVTFGNSVMWTGRNKGGPPVHRAMPLMECFWQENEDGVVDYMTRAFQMKVGVAKHAYPTPKILEKAQENNGDEQYLEFLHVTEPREGGAAGAEATRKPFASMVICKSTGEIARISGYDTFPWAVTRFAKRAGDPYGDGIGINMLPLLRLLNEMEETILRAAELEADPPLVSLVGHIPKVDRRPGGLTNLTNAQLRKMDARGAIERLYEGANPSIAIELVRDIRQQVHFLGFIDWMALPTGTTATEVYERRDIRLRTMTPIVARGTAEKVTSLADRIYDLTQDDFDRPPDSLDGAEIAWEYFSPLAQAQKEDVIRSFQRTMAVLDMAIAHNPEAGDNIDIDDQVRSAAQAAGTPLKAIMTEQEIAAIRQDRARLREQERQVMMAQAAAGAARDAGQAAASVAGAQQAAA